MKKTITMLLALFTATSSHAENIDLAKQRVLEMLRKDPSRIAEAKKQLGILLSGQHQQQNQDPTQSVQSIVQHKKALERKKKLEGQRLLDFAQQKHAEAVARRQQGLSLSTQAFDKKPNHDKKALPEGTATDEPLPMPVLPPSHNGLKYPDVHMPYGQHEKLRSDYKKDNFPNR